MLAYINAAADLKPIDIARQRAEYEGSGEDVKGDEPPLPPPDESPSEGESVDEDKDKADDQVGGDDQVGRNADRICQHCWL